MFKNDPIAPILPARYVLRHNFSGAYTTKIIPLGGFRHNM